MIEAGMILAIDLLSYPSLNYVFYLFKIRFDCLKNVPARRYTNFEMNYDRFFLGSVFKDEGACRIYRPGEEDYGTNRCPHQIYVRCQSYFI